MIDLIKSIIKYIIFGIVCLFGLFVVLLKMDTTQGQDVPKERVVLYQYPIMNALDEVKEIIHWEIWEDTLYIYTQKDSIRDEIERFKYIRSLDNDSLWE